MRTRNKEIVLWLTEDEYTQLKACVAKTPLTMQEYLRTVLRGVQPKERVPYDLIEVLKSLQQINNNLNQIAMKVNTLNFVDTVAYWDNVALLKKTIQELLEVMYG